MGKNMIESQWLLGGGKKWKLVAQSCLTLFDPMDSSPPGSSVHGILQARILEWVAISFPRGIFTTQGSNPGLLHCKQILYWVNRDYIRWGRPVQRSNTDLSKWEKTVRLEVQRTQMPWTRNVFCSRPTWRVQEEQGEDEMYLRSLEGCHWRLTPVAKWGMNYHYKETCFKLVTVAWVKAECSGEDQKTSAKGSILEVWFGVGLILYCTGSRFLNALFRLLHHCIRWNKFLLNSFNFMKC